MMFKSSQLNFIDYKNKNRISNWHHFASHVRVDGAKLLANLDNFFDPILIAGCQRSGTTALSRLITESEGITKFWTGGDEELEGALILAGCLDYQELGRHCFQTTYLNNNYGEYFEHSNYKLIWVLRNPFSVIYSMLNNWKAAALDRLFKNCGAGLLKKQEKYWFERFGPISIPKMRKACLSYNGKTSQIFVLNKQLNAKNFFIIDYDKLIKEKTILLPAIYDFLDLPYKSIYAEKLNGGSLAKAQNFSFKQFNEIEKTCLPLYIDAQKLIANL
jgi:hypothetical protein